MKQRIIYPTPGDGVAIIIPATDDLTIEQIAQKDVPAGAPYFIIDADNLPALNTQEAWEVDFTVAQCEITINQSKLIQKPKRVVYAQWVALFNEVERAWIFSCDHVRVREIITRITAENGVDLNSPEVAVFLDLCIELGSPLTPARKAEIIRGEKPSSVISES